jgi:HEAT repeat protein
MTTANHASAGASRPTRSFRIMRRLTLLVPCFLGITGLLAFACGTTQPTAALPHGDDANEPGTAAHRDLVMTSRFCAGCHPADYAEHKQNTHGRAFFDEEARLATRGFRREDCIRCHTPRPVFETGIGMTPMQRWTDLEEGNTCMSCHGRAGYDYSRFQGGAECKQAFEPEVGTVADCASCHRIAGTPDQWSRAEHGHKAGRVCLDCHMPEVERPVAVGQPPRTVRSHLFPASSSESQLRKAYGYQAAVEGNEVVVKITNKGAGHNFPTANRQRAVESLVVVRDADGKEVSRSRLTCRYPYASELEPHQLTAPRSSQIPSGKTTEHRVPLTIAGGTVETRLYFKIYRPIEDTDPNLSRCLEERRLPFAGITPSTKAVEAAMEVTYPVALTDLNDFLSQSGLANTARAQPVAGAKVELPPGTSPAELDKIAALLESHLPEARVLARNRLAEVFPASADVLVTALTRWSNETFNEAKRTFLMIGQPAVPTLARALEHPHLYARVHARELLAELKLAIVSSDNPWAGANEILPVIRKGLTMANPLDRRSAALALGELRDRAAIPQLRALLDDGDWDVVMAASRSLGVLADREAVPAMTRAIQRTPWPETRRELAVALARLGSSAGVQPLLRDLDEADQLQREYTFRSLFAITGVHLGYEPGAPAAERLKAWGRLQAWWSAHGSDAAVRGPELIDPKTTERVWDLIEQLGGGTDTRTGGDDAEIMNELRLYGRYAVPGLIEGLTFTSGFADKRARICELLGDISKRTGDRDAAPFLAAILRDPVPAVTEWACLALEQVKDPEVIGQLRHYADLVPALTGHDRGEGPDAPADRLLARAARTRLMLGDELARTELVNLLVSANATARQIAIGALQEKYGEDRGYDPEAAEPERRAAAARWQQ